MHYELLIFSVFTGIKTINCDVLRTWSSLGLGLYAHLKIMFNLTTLNKKRLIEFLHHTCWSDS